MTTEVTKNYIEETKRLANAIEQSYMILAERLKRIRDEELWNGRYNNFPEFLMEIGMSEGNVSKLINVYEYYVLGFGFTKEQVASRPYSVLYSARKLLPDKRSAQKFFDNTEGLTRRDVEEQVRDMKNPGCEHDFQEVCFHQCTKCNLKQKYA